MQEIDFPTYKAERDRLRKEYFIFETRLKALTDGGCIREWLEVAAGRPFPPQVVKTISYMFLFQFY
jgi:hypothetical protein